MILLKEEIPVEGKYILSGSRAIGTRIAKDIDLICHSSQLIGDGWKFDSKKLSAQKDIFDVILTDNHPTLQEMVDVYGRILPMRVPAALFILKAAHIHLPRKNWFCDIQDYHVLKNEVINYWISPNEEARIFKFIRNYKAELDEINKTHQMNLKVSKDEFFNDGVKKYIDHDKLHEVFAHGKEPIYKKCQDPKEEVYCSLDKWDALKPIEKIQMVLEETYVIAAERFIIPKAAKYKFNLDECLNIREINQLQTILNALKKVCTTLSSGWFRDYCINNYFEICNHIDMEYFELVCHSIFIYEAL